MAQGSYRRQLSGGAPAVPQGHIVHLQAPPGPIAVSKRTRSINVPHETVPGLAIHAPRALMPPPTKSSLQQDSLDQLKKLKLALAGDRQQNRNISGEGKQIRMSTIDNFKGKEDQKNASAGGYAVPRIPSGAVPVQSPYSLYSYLMAGQVDDDPTAKPSLPRPAPDENNKHIAGAIEVLPPPTQMKKRSSSLSRSKKPQSMQQAIKTVVKNAGAAQSRSAPLAVQPFDMQRSLEKQLATLPGSRLPGTSTQSFDDHSYILASGTASVGSKKSKHSINERHVSVLPCESFTPSSRLGVGSDQSVMEKTLSKTSMKRNRQTRLPPQEHADTIRIDKGLMCVDPNNLKPQMQEILQRKHKDEKVPVQQVGKIVEAIDLVERSKNKGMKVKLGSTLKDLFPDRFKDSRSRSRPPRNSKSSNEKIDYNRKILNQFNQQSQNKSTPAAPKEKDDERLWVKQTIEQENYKITKVLASGGKKSESNPMTDPPNIEGVTSGILSEVVAASESVGSGKAGNNMEIVMAAEGKSPMYKADRLDTTPKELIVDDTKKNTDVQKKHASNRLAKLARRLTAKQRDIISERLGEKGKESVARSHSDGAKKNTTKQQSLNDQARSLGVSGRPNGLKLNVETRPVSPTVDGLGGSFCLTPATLENSFSLEHSFTDLANIFVQQQEVDRHTANSGENKTKDSPLKRNIRSKAEIIRQGRLALMVTLKNRIISELKMQKMREIEAAKKGEIISEEEKAKQLEIVRRLHLRREALQHLGDDDIRNAFNERLQNFKKNAEQKGKGTGDKPDENSEVGMDGQEDDEEGESRNGATPNRKSVSFARQTNQEIISPKAAPNADDEDGDTILDNESLYYDEIISGPGSHFARRGIMSWTNCGVYAADACVPSSEEIRKLQEKGLETVEKNFQKKSWKDGESTTVASRASRSTRSRITQKSVPQGLLQCAPVRAGCNDDDDFSYDSDSSGSRSSYSSAPKPRRDRRNGRRKSSKSSKSRRRSDASFASGRSRGSYQTQDSRRTEFTEDTRGSYDTRDTRHSRGSYVSYDSYEDRNRRSRKGHRKGSRKYVSNSVAGTEFLSEFMSEYTEDDVPSLEDALLRCGAE